MSMPNYSPDIFGEPEISVQPLDDEISSTTPTFMIRVRTTLTPPNSLSASEDNQEDNLPTAVEYPGLFFLPITNLGLTHVPSSLQIRSTVAVRIEVALAPDSVAVEVIVNLWVGLFPDDDDDDDGDDNADDDGDDNADDLGFVPASPEAILGLENNKIRVSSVEPCPVCLEDIPAGSEAIHLPCSHCYHEDCIVEWLRMNRVCPICRFELL